MIRFILIATLFVMWGCKAYKPQTGDLLFQDMDCGPMCDAIEAVTQGAEGAKFSHIGIVKVTNDTTCIIEAVGKGVILTPLADFLARSTDNNGHPKVWAGRLRKSAKEQGLRAVEIAESYLGQAYDDCFLPDNGKYYCSELVYLSYKNKNGQPVFCLEPMTFKTPGSNHYFDVWIDYYAKLGVPIPEGVPGINPAGISRSKAIKIVHKFGRVSIK